MRKTIERDAQGNEVITPQTNRKRTVRIYEPGEVAYKTAVMLDGLVQLPTGAEYDLTEPWIAVKPEHVQALHHASHKELHRRGFFLHVPLEGE